MTLAFGMPGMNELMIIGFIALLIFGNRLPSVMRSLGKSVTEFKKGVAGIDEDVNSPVTTTTASTADQKATVDTH